MGNSKKNKYVLKENNGSSSDNFRNAVGNYWKITKGFPEYGDPTAQAPKPQKVMPGKPPRASKRSFFKIIPKKEVKKKLDDIPFFEIDNQLEIYGDKNFYGSVDNWMRYMKGNINRRKAFYDYGVDISLPLPESTIKKQNSGPGTLYRKTDFNYNYYARLYEESSKDDQISENSLPDIYFLAKHRQEDPEASSVVFEALTAGGQLDPGTLTSIRETSDKQKNPTYFNEFGNAQKTAAAFKKDYIVKKTKNLIFDTDCSDFFKVVREMEPLFPMSINIQFMTEARNQFTEVLEDSRLSTSLMSYLALLPRKIDKKTANWFGVKNPPMVRYFESNKGDPKTNTFVKSKDVQPRMIDLFVWLRNLAAYDRSGNPSLTFVDGRPNRKLSGFENFMYLIIFTGKLQTLIEQHQRSYIDISDGAPAFSETICYKIEKSFATGAPVQTAWMPNTNEIDLVNYIDTQVKYNKEYRYKITAYQFVLGTEYKYSNLEFPDSYGAPNKKKLKRPPANKTGEIYTTSDKATFRTKFGKELFKVEEKRQSTKDEKYFKATVKVTARPSVKIVELPFFNVAGRVIDDPPVPPHIDIVPYRGVENKLLINMNTSVGEYVMDPVVLTESDQKMINEIRLAKDLPPGSQITYTTDDALAAFEIYRMKKPPQKIEDFVGNLRVKVRTDVDSKTLQKASSASYRDSLVPNTDYYYIFRAIDIHGKISNPTDVYKIQLVNNDGAIYPLIEIYQMKPIKPQKPMKSAKKLINIAPTISQAMVNYKKSQMGDGTSAFNIQSLMLGVEKTPLFGERFKIRLTSRQTGRKIDLNLNFNVEFDKKQK